MSPPGITHQRKDFPMNSNSTDAGVLVGIRKGTAPAAVTAGTRNSVAVDRLGFDSGVLIAQTGAATGTRATG